MFLDSDETTEKQDSHTAQVLKTLSGTLKLQSTIDDLTKKRGYGAGACAE